MHRTLDKEEVKRNVDMLKLASRYVKLARVGNVYQGLCPFHSEDTPSFTVYPETQSFHCFGCGASGDQLEFYREIEHINSFPEVLERLGNGLDLTGCSAPLPQSQPPKAPQPKSAPSCEILDMYALAFKMSREALFDETSTDADGVRQYLYGRGFSLVDLQKLRIGAYLPKHREYFKNNYDKELAKKSGLISYGKGYNYRILIPQYNHEGVIVGFSFRLTIEGTDQDGQPFRKYKFTPLYDKDYPFNMFFAAPAIKKTGEVVVVEGHLDALALMSQGVDNVVCLGGHSLNEDHISHTVRCGAQNILLWMDNDDPGTKGAMKAVKLVLFGNKAVILIISCSYNDVGEINKEPDRDKRRSIITESIKSATFGSTWLGKAMTRGIGDRDKPRLLEEGKDIYSKILDNLHKQYFLKSFSRGIGLKLADIAHLFSGNQGKKKPLKKGNMKGVLLERLDVMIKQDADLPHMKKFLIKYYGENKKKMPREVREMIIYLLDLLKKIEIDGFKEYISNNLPSNVQGGR